MDFGLLPPEVNSSRMYSGPGPESMLAAAAAWDGVAAELTSAAVSYGSVVSTLIVEPWMGPAAAAMAAAATPYVGWLAATAALAKETATQARAAAEAFGTAFAMTVPPSLVAANRSRLMSLVAANILGQNSAAIAATQAEYAEMWAQDAAVMYSYEGASAAASALPPFTPPVQGTGPAGPAAAAAATQAAGAGAVADAQATLAQLPPGILSDILSALAANADPLTSGLLGIASTLNPQVGSAQPIVIPTPIGELDVIALYIASIATGSIALAITNTARPWHIGLYGNAGGLGPTQGHPLSSATDEPEPHWGPFGGAAPVSAGFEADPTFVLHFTNAYEQGDEIVLDGFYEGDPQPLDTGGTKWEKLFRFLALDRLQSRLHRWRLNMVTGAVHEEQLSESITEFGTINADYAASSYRYTYAATGKPSWFLFDGLVKHDLLTGNHECYSFGDGVYGSETAMAPRVGSSAEDDGYLVTLTTDMNDDASYCLVFDAARPGDGPICKLALPERISSGTHSAWVPGAELRRWDHAESPAAAVGL